MKTTERRKMNIKRTIKELHSFKLCAFYRRKSSLRTLNNKINAKKHRNDLNNSSKKHILVMWKVAFGGKRCGKML